MLCWCSGVTAAPSVRVRSVPLSQTEERKDRNHDYDEADDVDDVVHGLTPTVSTCPKKVRSAGGKVVMPKTPIPGMGAYARIADTEGSVIGLFEVG